MHLRLNTATVVKNIMVLHVLQQSFRGFFFAKCLSVRLLNNIVDNICLYKDTRIFELVYNNLL